MKKIILIAIILFSLIVNPQITKPVGAEEPEGGTIDGDSIYWENSWGRLEVYPHTTNSEITQRQFCNATWKLAATDLDIAFRFNFTLIDAHIYELVGSEWIERTSSFKNVTIGEYIYYYVQEVHFEQDETRRFKWNYDVPFNSSGKWDFMAKLSSESIQYALENDRYVMVDPWWSSQWEFNRVIIINHDYTDGTLQQFPVMVVLPSTVSLKCNKGNSLRFLSLDNTTKYLYEIDQFNESGDSIVWVRIPSTGNPTKDFNFLVYYGNSVAIDNSSPATWGSSYSAVYHMNNSMDDSTQHYNNGSMGSGDVSEDVTGKIGTGFSFDGGDYINIPSDSSLNIGNEYTIEAWVYMNDTNLNPIVYTDGPVRTFDLQYDGLGAGDVFRNQVVDEQGFDPEVNSSTAHATGTWFYVATTYFNQSATGLKIYINGTDDSVAAGDTRVIADSIADGDDMLIGGRLAELFNGYIDEVRISSDARSVAWIAAAYDNIANYGDFIQILGEDTRPSVPVVNATTNISRNNATFNGYIHPNSNDYQGNYDLGFLVSTQNPPTVANSVLNLSYGTRAVVGGIAYEVFTTALSPEITYYIKGWHSNATVFNLTDNTDGFTTWSLTYEPTGVTATVESSNSSLQLTWTDGISADKTLIVRKANSYPSSVSDGTAIYNSTSQEHWETDLSGNYRYRMWSWNESYDEYSTNYSDVEYGALVLNCYNESDPTMGLTWGILIKNADGSVTYNESVITNPHIINVEDIPYGDDIYFLVNSTNYYSRTYHFDLALNNVYNISFYLPMDLPNDDDTSYLYRFDVTDQAESRPVADCRILVQRYNNVTDKYENISILFTDGGGYVFVYLQPGVSYQVNLSKAGYKTQSSEYVPFEDVYTQSFVLEYEDWEPDEDLVFSDYVSFSGYLWGVGDYIYLNYTDSLLQTIDTNIYIYSYNYTEEEETLIDSDSRSSDSSFSLSVNTNGSNFHRVVLDLNHTTFGYVRLTLYFEGFNASLIITDFTTFDDLFKDVWKTNPFGWSNFIVWIILVGIYFSWGERGSGLALLFSGFFLIFINQYMPIVNVFADSVIPVLHIAVGFMVVWKDAKKEWA